MRGLTVSHVAMEQLIYSPGAPVVKITPKFLEIQIGQEGRFTCSVTGTPKPKVTWHKLDGLLPTHFVENGQLILPKVRKIDNGDYICRAVNNDGTDEDSAKLRTTGKSICHLLFLNFIL